MTSWNDWAEKVLLDDHNHVCSHYSGIFGLDGTPWALAAAAGTASPNPLEKLSPDFFTNAKSALDSGMPSGNLKIGDTSYMIIRADSQDRFLIGRKEGKGLTLVQGKQCFIVGLFVNNDVQPGSNTSQACCVKDHLVQLGY